MLEFMGVSPSMPEYVRANSNESVAKKDILSCKDNVLKLKDCPQYDNMLWYRKKDC